MNTTAIKNGTQIPLVYDKELKFYIEFLTGMEILKHESYLQLQFTDFLHLFRAYFEETNIPAYTKYQIINAISGITKYDVKINGNLINFSKKIEL